MEKPKTNAERRKEEFDRTAEAAKQLGDKALREIDAILRDEEELAEALRMGVKYENITPEDAEDALRAYHATRFPIHDGDPLASPIGFYERHESIYE